MCSLEGCYQGFLLSNSEGSWSRCNQAYRMLQGVMVSGLFFFLQWATSKVCCELPLMTSSCQPLRPCCYRDNQNILNNKLLVICQIMRHIGVIWRHDISPNISDIHSLTILHTYSKWAVKLNTKQNTLMSRLHPVCLPVTGNLLLKTLTECVTCTIVAGSLLPSGEIVGRKLMWVCGLLFCDHSTTYCRSFCLSRLVLARIKKKYSSSLTCE